MTNKPNEIVTIFKDSESKDSHDVFITLSPVTIDHDTDPQAVQGMPFYSPSRIPPGVSDLADLVTYCRQIDHGCTVICNQTEFTPEYIARIRQKEQGSKWRLYGIA